MSLLGAPRSLGRSVAFVNRDLQPMVHSSSRTMSARWGEPVVGVLCAPPIAAGAIVLAALFRPAFATAPRQSLATETFAQIRDLAHPCFGRRDRINPGVNCITVVARQNSREAGAHWSWLGGVGHRICTFPAAGPIELP